MAKATNKYLETFKQLLNIFLLCRLQRDMNALSYMFLSVSRNCAKMSD